MKQNHSSNRPKTERLRWTKNHRSFKRPIRPSDGLLAAFLIPIIILILIFIQKGIFPFGGETFIQVDMYHQYAPFLSEFHNKLTEGRSLLYSWNIGMGVNFTALYTYYLSSPLNWLMILCPKEFIIEFMTYFVVLKTGLCGLTFAYYLRCHNKTSDFGIAFFGIFYALSGYMAAYNWNIIWLDCIFLFPLIVLGLERLVRERKGGFYCIMLGFSILSNYYISIMICIFLVIYFICLLILERNSNTRNFFVSLLQFGVYSLLAGAMAAILLVPEIYALQYTISGTMAFPDTLEMYFPIFDELARHMGNVPVETGIGNGTKWPNIYCGVAVYIFFLLYLTCKKISVREKAVYCGLMFLFLASFSINVLDYIWHGFHFPNALPARQSFLYIFLVLSLCYRAYMHLDAIPKKHIALSLGAAVCYVLLAQKLVTDDTIHFIIFYVAILFLSIYGGLLYLFKNPRYSRMNLGLLTLGIIILESTFNMNVTSIDTSSRSFYIADDQDVLEQTSSLTSENGFYRIKKISEKTKNDGAWLNIPTASLFSSIAHNDVREFFKNVGCLNSVNAYSLAGSTPLIDSLFSVKYSLYSSLQDNPRIIPKHFSGNIIPGKIAPPLSQHSLSENSVAEDTGMPDFSAEQKTLSNETSLAFQLKEIEGTNAGTSFSFMPIVKGEYYLYLNNKKVTSISVETSQETKSYDSIDSSQMIPLGYFESGEMVTVSNQNDQEALEAKAFCFFENNTLGNTYLYENPHTLPLGFLMPAGMEVNWQVDMPNPADVQNNLADVLDIPVALIEVETKKTGNALIFIPEQDGEYYVYLPNKKGTDLLIEKSGTKNIFKDANSDFMVELGFCKAGETIKITNNENLKALDAKLYLFEQSSVKSMYETLNESPLILTQWEDTKLKGTIAAAEPGTIFLSIPYDKGWHVKVDGQDVITRKVFGAFTGIDVSAGLHTITMQYMPQGLKMGALISMIAVGLLLLLLLKSSKSKHHRS